MRASGLEKKKVTLDTHLMKQPKNNKKGSKSTNHLKMLILWSSTAKKSATKAQKSTKSTQKVDVFGPKPQKQQSPLKKLIFWLRQAQKSTKSTQKDHFFGPRQAQKSAKSTQKADFWGPKPKSTRSTQNVDFTWLRQAPKTTQKAVFVLDRPKSAKDPKINFVNSQSWFVLWSCPGQTSVSKQ